MVRAFLAGSATALGEGRRRGCAAVSLDVGVERFFAGAGVSVGVFFVLAIR
jgi:hypothetical protein